MIYKPYGEKYKQYKEKIFDIETRVQYDTFCAMVKQGNTLTAKERYFLTLAAWQNYIEYNHD